MLAGAGIAVWLLVRPAPTSLPHLLVGVDDDTLKWTRNPLGVVRWQRALGVEAVRVWIPWRGERAPVEPTLDELARAQEAARRTFVVLAVFGSARDTPVTTAQQARFCGYAQRALALVPNARAVVVWNEANSPTYWSGTAAEYETLLARCYDMLHRRGLTILDSTASGHAPDAFLLALGASYRASGRTRPLVDAFGHNPYPRTADEPPDALHGAGFLGQGDYPRLMRILRSSFRLTPDIWYLEDGFQSEIPLDLRPRYFGRETAPTLTPAAQAGQLAAAIRLAACQPHVRAFFNFELVDETGLAGWQSGLIWRGVHRKPAALAFARAARQVASGCPGHP